MLEEKHFPSNRFVCLAFVGCGVVFDFPSFFIKVARWNGCGLVICVTWLCFWRLCRKPLIFSRLASSLLLFMSCSWIAIGSFQRGKFGCTGPHSLGMLVWRWPLSAFRNLIMFMRWGRIYLDPIFNAILLWDSLLLILCGSPWARCISSSLSLSLVIDKGQLLPLWGKFGSNEVPLLPVVFGLWVANGSLVAVPTSSNCPFPLYNRTCVCSSLGLFVCILVGKVVMASRRCSYGSVISICIVGRKRRSQSGYVVLSSLIILSVGFCGLLSPCRIEAQSNQAQSWVMKWYALR